MDYPEIPPNAPPDMFVQRAPISNVFAPTVNRPVDDEQPQKKADESDSKWSWSGFKENKTAIIALSAIVVIVIIVLAYFFYKWYEDNKDRPTAHRGEGPPLSIEERIRRDVQDYRPPPRPKSLESATAMDIINPGYKVQIPKPPPDMSAYVEVEEDDDSAQPPPDRSAYVEEENFTKSVMPLTAIQKKNEDDSAQPIMSLPDIKEEDEDEDKSEEDFIEVDTEQGLRFTPEAITLVVQADAEEVEQLPQQPPPPVKKGRGRKKKTVE